MEQPSPRPPDRIPLDRIEITCSACGEQATALEVNGTGRLQGP